MLLSLLYSAGASLPGAHTPAMRAQLLIPGQASEPGARRWRACLLTTTLPASQSARWSLLLLDAASIHIHTYHAQQHRRQCSATLEPWAGALGVLVVRKATHSSCCYEHATKGSAYRRAMGHILSSQCV